MTRRSLRFWWSIHITTSFPRAAKFAIAYGLSQRQIIDLEWNDPALTGGGSLGYNQMVEQGL
jgi:hypothetical protein